MFYFRRALSFSFFFSFSIPFSFLFEFEFVRTGRSELLGWTGLDLDLDLDLDCGSIIVAGDSGMKGGKVG